MAVYGDIALIKKMIRATPGMESDADVNDRIDALNKAVSLALEDACERTWGTPVADTSDIVWVGPADTIVLPRPARAITSITYGGTLVGATMTGGTTITASSLYYPIVDRNGLIYAIRSNASTVWWWNWALVTGPYQTVPVVITGDFVSSDNDATVPDDIVYAASRIVVETLKDEKASSFGAIGPDGTVAPLRDAFSLPVVKRIIDKYRRERLVAV